MDLIHEVTVSKEKLNKILGQGFKDSELFSRSVVREYNTERILGIIKSNPKACIYSTWGKGPTIQEWRQEVSKIQNIIPLASPSMVAKVPKGRKKFNYKLADWKGKIKNECKK